MRLVRAYKTPLFWAAFWFKVNVVNYCQFSQNFTWNIYKMVEGELL